VLGCYDVTVVPGGPGAQGAGCSIVKTLPSADAEDVPVVGELRLTFSAPIDVTSLQGRVTLQQLGGETVPADVALDAQTDADVIVRPKKSLRFWGSYSVIVNDGVKTTNGDACEAGEVAFATVRPTAAPRALRPAPVSGLALVGSSVIAASEGYRGLQMYDVSDPNSASLRGDLVTKFGPRALVVAGKYGYAPAGTLGVQIFDLSDPQKPALIGRGGTPGRASDVAVVEKNGHVFLIVADGPEGARVLDATDPGDVVDVGALDIGDVTSPYVGAVDVEGDRVALTDGTRVVLLSLPDPGSLGTQAPIASVDLGATLSDVLLDGSRLFVAKGFSGVASYDISNAAAPKLVDSKSDPAGACPAACTNVTSSLVRDGSDLFVAFAREGVARYSVGPSGALTLAAQYKVPSSAHAVAVTADRVLVGGDEGLVVFDRAGDGSAPLWLDPMGHGTARTVTVRNGFAYVGAAFRGVQTFSLAKPDSPDMVDRDDTPGSLVADVAAFGVATDGKVLTVGDGRAGITLFDLSDPKNPKLGGTVDTPDALTTVAQQERVAFGCDGNAGVVAVDASDPKAPKLLSEALFKDVPGDACAELSPAGKLVFVARRQGLGVLDATDPGNMAWKALVTLPQKDSVTSVRAVGKHVLAISSVFDYEGTNYTTTRLRVLDVADPSAPKLVWSSDDLGGAASLSVAGDIAFVSSGASGVKVFDISDIEHPVLEGAVETPGNAASTFPGGDALYVVQGAGGLQAIHTGPLPHTK
jgi:hypothetical protein